MDGERGRGKWKERKIVDIERVVKGIGRGENDLLQIEG